MKRDEALKTLAEHREELRQRFGVKSLALFGSVVRDEATETSDVDLLVEFDRPVGLLHVIGTEQYLEKLLSVNKVDLVLTRAVLPEFKDGILAEAINAF
ncbi:MAG: nucleotidyltransferase family protein [candidate division NC10 bacterium]|nr:nucleotidyltransferase family protein [candidate division NC10 bacterium]MDE2322617.1 nucleotidyltransferase family protein [candidate division NC10 bacterium]